jgi:hypothetical protein
MGSVVKTMNFANFKDRGSFGKFTGRALRRTTAGG